MSIGYVSDDGYAKYLPTNIYGLLKNNPDSVVDIYILTDGISDKHKSDIEKVVNHFQNARIEFVEIDLSIFTDMRIPSLRDSFATYYKLMFEQMLSRIDRLLYLDIDAVVVGNLRNLYDTDLDDNYILGANHMTYESMEEQGLKRQDRQFLNVTPKTHLNAGTILFDLQKMRQNDITTTTLLNYARDNADIIAYHDQDVLNMVFKGKISFDQKYIALYFFIGDGYYKERVKNLSMTPVIVHGIVRSKPWLLHKSTLLGKIWKRDYDEVSKIIGQQDYRQPTRIDLLKQHHLTQALCPNFLMPFVDRFAHQIKGS